MKDIDAVRRENLRLIEMEAGGTTEAASLCGMSPSQFTNLRDGAKDSKTGKPRGMRKETARRIEVAAGKKPGWLDADHSIASPFHGSQVIIGTGGYGPGFAQELVGHLLATTKVEHSRIMVVAGDAADALAASLPVGGHHPSLAQALEVVGLEVGRLPPLVQSAGRDALAKWAAGNATTEQTAAILAALAQAATKLPEMSAALAETPVTRPVKHET